MARKISCFVSFSARDGDEKSIRFFIDYLTQRLEERVAFKAYFDQKSGTDLESFMKNDLTSAEAVIALFSPDYKHKADNFIKSGVLTEYLHIIDRLEGKSGVVPFLFIPLFWRGANFEEATPAFFTGRNYVRELRSFQAFGVEQSYLPDRVASLLRPQIDRLVSDLTSRCDEADPEFSRLKNRIDQALLAPSAISSDDRAEEERPERQVEGVFFRKSERTPITIAEFSERFFVKTAAFGAIGLHHKMAFTGRKGSGKTTLLKVYKHLNATRYFVPIDVEVNDWNLHFLLQHLTFRSAEGDLHYTAEESKIFDYIWPVFLSLCMARSLCASNPQMTFDTILVNRRYHEQFAEAKDRYESLFQMAITVVTDFMAQCIERAPTKTEGAFKSALLSALNVRACTEHLLGRRYAGLLAATTRDPMQRRFLFCLDRFDTEIQKYRKDLKDRNVSDGERLVRERREVFWIQGLVEMIDHLRSPDQYAPNQEFYKHVGPLIDFCVPLPKDRLYEVQLRRRDSIVGDIYEEISWQAYELLTMLRKRLQAVWQISDDQIDKQKHVGARQRYEQVIQHCGRKIPPSCDIRTNGGVHTSDLFLNVLRHTFFRPRDVIIYYAEIVLRVELAHRRGKPLSSSAVARLISEQTYKIVDDEFVGEFSDTFKNIRDVMQRFRGQNQVMKLDELMDKLANLSFIIYGEDDIVDLGKKVRFLYEIGFIGVCADQAQLGGISRADFDFYFLKPRIAANLEQPIVLEALKFAIHPVFIESLTLRLNAASPVMLLSWEGLEELDSF